MPIRERFPARGGNSVDMAVLLAALESAGVAAREAGNAMYVYITREGSDQPEGYVYSDTPPDGAVSFIACEPDGVARPRVDAVAVTTANVPDLAVREIQDHIYTIRRQCADLVRAASVKKHDGTAAAEQLANYRILKMLALCQLLDICVYDGKVGCCREEIGIIPNPPTIANKAVEQEMRDIVTYAMRRSLLEQTEFRKNAS